MVVSFTKQDFYFLWSLVLSLPPYIIFIRGINFKFHFRDTANKYLPAAITGFDSTTQHHQLQLHPNQTKSPLPTASTGSPISVDLSKADVRSVPFPATDVPTPSSIETPPPPTLALRTSRAAAARTVAQTPVHTDIAHSDIAHTDNITTAVARSTPTPTKGKRFFISTNDLPSPATAKRKTQKVSKKALASDKKENPTNDALLLAFEDPVPATITSPFSADSPRALALDHELSADLPGFLSNPLAKAVTSSFVSLPLLLPDNDINDDVFFNDNDDDVFPDVPMAELAPKRTLRSSRSTDAKSSAAPVDDDVKKKKRNVSDERVSFSRSFGLKIRKSEKIFRAHIRKK